MLWTVTTVYDVKAVLKITSLLCIRLQWPASLHLTMDIYAIQRCSSEIHGKRLRNL